MNMDIGDYITNGKKDFLVIDVREYEGKKYAEVFDEEEENLYFYEIIPYGDGIKFERVKSNAYVEKLIIYFSDIKKIVEGEISVEEI